MAKNRILTWAFLPWVLLITVLSLISFPDDPDGSLDIPHLDKAVHFVFYFVAAILGVFFFRGVGKSRNSRSGALMASLLFVVIYGTILEVIQGMLTHDRSGEINDVLANTAGGVMGILLVQLWLKRER